MREYRGEEAYRELVTEVLGYLDRGDVPNLVRSVDRNFGAGTYSLRLLFRDQQRKIVGQIMERALAEAAALYRNFYAQYSTMARFISELGIPLPARFQMAVDFTLHEDLLAALSTDIPDPVRIQALLEQIRRTGIPLDKVTLEFAFRKVVERAAEQFRAAPIDPETVRHFQEVVNLCPALPFTTNLWAAQNVYHQVLQSCLSDLSAKGRLDDFATWRREVDTLGISLGFQGETISTDFAAASD